jgi:hypothetical protein
VAEALQDPVPGARGQGEQQTRHRIAEPAARRHRTGEGTDPEDDRSRPGDLLGHGEYVDGRVLAVRVGADHVLARVGSHDVFDAGLQGPALAPVGLVGEHRGSQATDGVEHVRGLGLRR